MDDTFSRKLAANCSKHPERLQNLDVVTPETYSITGSTRYIDIQPVRLFF
jgi:hypothetical protein